MYVIRTFTLAVLLLTCWSATSLASDDPLADVLGDAVRRTRKGRFARFGPPALQFAAPAGFLDAAFDFAHGIEVAIDFGSIWSAQTALELIHVFTHKVEHAGAPIQGRLAFQLIAACTEEAFKD